MNLHEDRVMEDVYNNASFLFSFIWKILLTKNDFQFLNDNAAIAGDRFARSAGNEPASAIASQPNQSKDPVKQPNQKFHSCGSALLWRSKAFAF